MDAWEILQGNSTAPVGSDAWVHLNNQSGEGGGDIFVGGDLTMYLSPALSMISIGQELTMNMKPSLTMNLETDELSVNIQDDMNMDLGNC